MDIYVLYVYEVKNNDMLDEKQASWNTFVIFVSLPKYIHIKFYYFLRNKKKNST